MESFVWFLVGSLAVAAALYFLYRSRAKFEASLTPEELAKKRALEDMAP